MNLQDLDWHLLYQDENGYLPKNNTVVLVYCKTPNDVFDLGKGYFESVEEVHFKIKNGVSQWKTMFYSLNERWIVAWTYFDYPKFG